MYMTPCFTSVASLYAISAAVLYFPLSDFTMESVADLASARKLCLMSAGILMMRVKRIRNFFLPLLILGYLILGRLVFLMKLNSIALRAWWVPSLFAMFFASSGSVAACMLFLSHNFLVLLLFLLFICIDIFCFMFVFGFTCVLCFIVVLYGFLCTGSVCFALFCTLHLCSFISDFLPFSR